MTAHYHLVLSHLNDGISTPDFSEVHETRQQAVNAARWFAHDARSFGEIWERIGSAAYRSDRNEITVMTCYDPDCTGH